MDPQFGGRPYASMSAEKIRIPADTVGVQIVAICLVLSYSGAQYRKDVTFSRVVMMSHCKRTERGPSRDLTPHP